ncbi:MAG TPA: sulfite exporter TauE/SafE family protein, partial [Actinomycetota bacterium]
MHIDFLVALAGLIVGFVVGLTGMGGGALMTPILVLLFHVEPLAAVSSDLVAAVIMKPVGGGVHLRHGTVNKQLVRWLMIGSIPCAFLGVFVLRLMGDNSEIQNRLKFILGVTLIVAAAAMVAKAWLHARRIRREHGLAALTGLEYENPPFAIKPVPTVLIGAVGGLVVGM